MKRPSPTIEKMLIGTALAGTFLLTASVFVPDLGHAEFESTPVTPGGGVESGGNQGVEQNVGQVDPHADFTSLGSFESTEYRLEAFGGGDEPLYSVYRRATGERLATLLPAYVVQQEFPELPLVDIDFAAESPVMMAEPEVLHFQGN